jgi:hypothetical protein
MSRAIGLVLMLGCLEASASTTQCSPDKLEACVHLADADARLACFDNEMQRLHVSASHVDPKPVDDNFGQRTETVPVQPLVATVTRVLPRPDNEYAFELDNGQLWEQAESKANVNIKPHDAVTIAPGALGGFFMTAGKHQRIRVHRIH